MSAELVKFEIEHLYEIRDESATEFIASLTPLQIKGLIQNPYVYTIRVEGRPVICGGVTMYWEGRGEAWAILDQYSRKHFISAHNLAKRFIESVPVRRIELAVERTFVNGHRWAKALGFELETPVAKSFLPDGKDASIYVRFN